MEEALWELLQEGDAPHDPRALEHMSRTLAVISGAVGMANSI